MLDLLNQEYTLVGVLVVAVVAGAWFLRDRLRKERDFMVGQIADERQERKEERAARDAQTAAFAEVTRATVAVADRAAGAMEGLTAEMAASRVQMTAVLDGLQGAVAEHSEQSAARDERVAHVLEQVCKRLDPLAGAEGPEEEAWKASGN